MFRTDHLIRGLTVLRDKKFRTDLRDALFEHSICK